MSEIINALDAAVAEVNGQGPRLESGDSSVRRVSRFDLEVDALAKKLLKDTVFLDLMSACSLSQNPAVIRGTQPGAHRNLMMAARKKDAYVREKCLESGLTESAEGLVSEAITRLNTDQTPALG